MAHPVFDGHIPGESLQEFRNLMTKHQSAFALIQNFHSGPMLVNSSFKQAYLPAVKAEILFVFGIRHGAAAGGSVVTATLPAK